MKLILTREVSGLGLAGDVVTVKDGFARNYLLPQKLAYAATKANLRKIELEKKNRQARYQQLQRLKQEGEIGENNKGYVTSLKGNAAAATLTADENQDRRILYEALAEQNKLGSAGLLEIQGAFAEVQSEKADRGDMIQSSSGDWKQKSS